jgi:hypothetical protein
MTVSVSHSCVKQQVNKGNVIFSLSTFNILSICVIKCKHDSLNTFSAPFLKFLSQRRIIYCAQFFEHSDKFYCPVSLGARMRVRVLCSYHEENLSSCAS